MKTFNPKPRRHITADKSLGENSGLIKGPTKRGNKIINTGQVNGINGDETRTGNKPNKG